MKNIELKVKIDNYDKITELVKFNSVCKGTFFQKDIYYLLTNPRLKTREEPNKTELIYYKRDNSEKAKDSRYFIVNINKKIKPIIKMVLNIFFKVKKVVEKQRELYIYKNTRIHLDKVKGLGEFLELETVVKNENNYDEYMREHNEITALLKLADCTKIAYSYSDLN